MSYFEVLSLIVLIVAVTGFICGILRMTTAQTLCNACAAGYAIAITFQVLTHHLVQVH